MIVTGTVHGRLVSGIPLAWDDQTTAAIDWGRARSELAVMSGGEAGLFALADSLATGEPVDLDDALVGLDPRNGQIVLAAFEHAIAIAPRTPRTER